MQALLTALKDEDSSVRSAAIRALGTAGQGSAEVVSALLAALTEEDLSVRFAAIRALGTAGQGSAEVVRHCWPRSRMKTFCALCGDKGVGHGRTGFCRSRDGLLAALKDKDSFVRSAAIRALGTAGQGSAEVVRRCWPRSRMKTGGCALRR